MHRPAVRTAAAVATPLLLFAALALLLAGRQWAPYPVEQSLHDWAVAHRPPWAVDLAAAVTDLGTGVPAYLAALAAGVLLARRLPGPRRWTVQLAVALAPALVLATGQAVRSALMHAFARPRPPAEDWVAASPSGWSFPSGHTFTAALAAGLLGCVLLTGTRRAWTVPLVAALGVAAVAVGLSRVYLGVHWPFDVLGGWLLAAGWLALALALAPPWARSRPGGP